MQLCCTFVCMFVREMKSSKDISSSLDVLGFAGSFICAIHCLAIPLMVSLGLLGHMHMHETFAWEWILFVFLLAIALLSLISSFRSGHRDSRPLLLGILGLAMIAIGESFPHSTGHFLSGIGGLALAAAHFLNWSLLRRLARS